MSDRIPPQHIEAERSVLGGMLLNQSAIDKVMDILGQNADLFYVSVHAEIYSAILALFSDRKPVDLITISNYMMEKGLLERCGGAVYIAELTDAVPTSANAAYYADIVFEKGIKRRAIQSMTTALGRLYDEDSKAIEVAEEVCRDACAIIEGKTSNTTHSMFEAVTESLHEIHRRRNLGDVPIGISTGMKRVDDLLLGLRPQTLNIIAARPSVGKSAIAVNIAYSVAMQGHPVLFFSLEMPFISLSNRILTIATETSYKALCDASLAERTNTRLNAAAALLGDSAITIEDSDTLSMAVLRSKARRFRLRHPKVMPVIIIDYLQICRFVEGRSKTRNDQIGEFTSDCKRLSRELDCPIILLCQLSREAEKGDAQEDPFKCGAHLKESGSIEQDADTILIATRYLPESMNPAIKDLGLDTNEVINAAVVKNRDGPVGLCPLVFTRPTQHIQALSDYVPQWAETEETNEEESF